jgi:hypothetical protein
VDDIRIEAVRESRQAFAAERNWPVLVLHQTLVGDLHFSPPDEPTDEMHEGSTLIHVPRIRAIEPVNRPVDIVRKRVDVVQYKALVAPKGQTYMSIGRERRSDLRLADFTVSAEHARIHLSPGTSRAWIEDVGARNGTALNGMGVVSGDRLALVTGDEVIVGCFVLLFLDAPDFHRYLNGEL